MAPDRPVARPHGSGSAGRPASPFPIGWFPSLTGPDRPVARPHCSGSSGCPDSPAPRAARRCRTPAANSGFPAFTSPRGKPPGWCPFPAVKVFLRPLARVAQEPAAIHFRFFSYPHLVHRIPPVIRMSQWLSTALCTATPQVTRRNSKNTSDDRLFVFTPSFPDDSPLIPNSRPRPPNTRPSPSSAQPAR